MAYHHDRHHGEHEGDKTTSGDHHRKIQAGMLTQRTGPITVSPRPVAWSPGRQPTGAAMRVALSTS